MSLPRRTIEWRVPAACVAVLAAGSAAFWLWRSHAISSPEAILASVRHLGATGWLAVIGMQALVAVSGLLPASLIGVAAGALYGVWLGFALAASGLFAGALIAFWLSRSLLRPVIARWIERRPGLARFDSGMAGEGWRLAFMIRLSPAIPFVVTSYLMGLSSMSLVDYLLGTLASLPALFGYVLIGTLAHAGASAWAGGAGWIRAGLLAVGAAATLGLAVQVGSKLRGSAPEPPPG